MRSHRPLTHDMIFALHWSAFSLLLISISQLPAPATWMRMPIDAVIIAGSLAYLVVALRRVYGVGWPGAVSRGVPLYVAYQVILIVWLKTVVHYAMTRV